MLQKESVRQSRIFGVWFIAMIAMMFIAPSAFAATKVLKLAHQWPAPHGDSGDVRSVMAAQFADYVDKYSNGALEVQVYPGNSLIPPRQQWDAMKSGALDMAVIVPSYFSGRVSELRGLNMMGLLSSNDAAYRFQDGEGGDALRQLFVNNGVRPVIWQWAPETVGFRKQKIATPDGLKGLRMRGPGPAIEEVYSNSGAGVVTMPSSDLYTALQTGALDGAITSFTSIRSYNLYEPFAHIAVSPTRGGLVYAAAPLVMSNTVWKELTPDQQNVIRKAAQKVQPWVKEQTDKEATENAAFFNKHGVDVYQLTPTQFDAWMQAAKPVVQSYAKQSSAAAKIVKYANKANQAQSQ